MELMRVSRSCALVPMIIALTTVRHYKHPMAFVGMDSGKYHNCAVNTDRNVECWGAGTTIGVEPHYGQSMVPLLGDVQKVAVGGYHSCAFDVNGDVTCWGLCKY